MSRIRRARRRGGALRDERGFALLATLVVMGVGALIVTGLLSLTFSTSAISGSSVSQSRQGHAADGALEAALTRIVDDNTGNLAAATAKNAANACTPTPTSPMVIDSIKVEVTCEPLASDLPPVPVGTAVTDNVWVVGDKYLGDGINGSAPKAWRQLPASCTPGSNCLPWSEALSPHTPSSDWNSGGFLSTGNEATVVHTGTEGLWVVGGMAVRKGAAAVRNPARVCPATGSCPLNVLSPGVGVSGAYTQGDIGLYGCEKTACPSTGANTGKAKDIAKEDSCGIQSPVPGTWDVPNVELTSVSGKTVCDLAGNRSLNAAFATKQRANTGPGGRPWTPAQVADPANAGTFENCSPADPVLDITPGVLKGQAMIALNSFMTGGCRNHVFWFHPGTYYVDVVDTSVPAAYQNAIRFDDPTSVMVFGTCSVSCGNLLTASIPSDTQALCNNSQPGVSITLSPRSTIQHTSGRVGICAGPVNDATALWQDKSVELGYEAAPTSVSGGVKGAECSGFFCFLNEIGSSIGTFFVNLFGGTPPNFGNGSSCTDASCYTQQGFHCTTKCGTQVVYAATFPDSGDTVGAPLRSALVLVQGSNLHADSSSTTRLDVWPKGRSLAGAAACSVTFPGVVYGGNVAAYDLMDASRTTVGFTPCSSALTDRKDLQGARVAITMNLNSDWSTFFSWTDTNFGTTVNSIRLRASWEPSYTGLSTSGDWQGGGGAIGQVRVNCNVHVEYVFDWPPMRFSGCDDGDNGNASVRVGWAPNLQSPGLGVNDTFVTDSGDASRETDPIVTALGATVGGRPWGRGAVGILAYNGENLGQDAWMTMSLVQNNTGVTLCTNRYDGLDPGQTRYLSLWELDQMPTSTPWAGRASAGSTCPSYIGGNLLRASDLSRYSVRVDFALRNNGVEAACKTGGAFTGLVGADLDCSYGFYVDNLKLSATVGDCTPLNIRGASAYPSCNTMPTNAYRAAATSMRATSYNQATIGTSTNPRYATFNVYGDVMLPRQDLDVRWTGPYAPDPIVTGSMWVGAVGSEQKLVDTSVPGALQSTAGVLCCARGKPAERKVKLQAWEYIDGKRLLRGEAIVHVNDVKASEGTDDGTWSPGEGSRIESWQLCRNRSETDTSCLRL